ncbi:TIGR04222 domain-containing membrane protein [Kibdelosporangium phytohabitans]|uniref:TIGR04222 domain-containing membrane protein n=1 Tax=Kibdelosporangium phytohabitans TaxID=860235 RepID=A0A0N9HSW3_9PSEU|nr:TIGR04222 domain-containing membrane protein [Kibdelosporangium phytohabitans]ALG08033.1 hypothetical protein AOZ06_14890 [Kibdelosporangium phytohabitans]MBE1471007.1 uncharacterized protein (TIGR04222 family) [Kibdelosporangium phytohabitans]
MNPWGISGPAFLWLYTGGFVVAGAVTLLLRRRIGSLTGAQSASEPLTVDETAILAGGRARVADAAIANLVERGAVRVERSGKLHVVRDSAYRAESALETRLLKDIKTRPGRTADYYRHNAARQPLFHEVEAELVRRGLLVDHVGRGTVFLTALPLVVLLVIGVVRAVNGANLGYPIGYLTVLIILTVVAVALAMRQIKRGPSAAARKLLSRGGHASSGAAALVARGGLAAYPDPVIASHIWAPGPRRKARVRPRSGSDSGYAGGAPIYASTCSSSSCSSSSSSSSCGGGGGGCGGGGS